MIRGRRFFGLAVRRMDGSVYRTAEPLSAIFTGPLRRVPLVRGILILIETLTLGFQVLTRSANIALDDGSENNNEISGWALFTTFSLSLSIGITLFFVLPLLPPGR